MNKFEKESVQNIYNSISNYFDNTVAKGTGSLKIKQINAINQLKKDNGIFFDPQILIQCINYLKPVVSEV